MRPTFKIFEKYHLEMEKAYTKKMTVDHNSNTPFK